MSGERRRRHGSRTASPFRRRIERKDLAILAALPLYALAAWSLSERLWPPFCRALCRFGWPPRRANPLIGKIAAAGPDMPAGASPEVVVDELEAGRREHYMQYMRAYRSGGWRPRFSIEGADRLGRAVADGRGVVLWVDHFVFNGLALKLALHGAGYGCTHLSRPEHGFSKTAFGVRWLNPIRSRIEDSYIDARVVIARGAEATAVRRLVGVLKRGGVVSITAGAWEGRKLVEADVLGCRLPLATGAASIAHATGAALIPATVVRDTATSAIRIVFGAPLQAPPGLDKADAIAALVAEYAWRLEPWIAAYPGQWRGWGYLKRASAEDRARQAAAALARRESSRAATALRRLTATAEDAAAASRLLQLEAAALGDPTGAAAFLRRRSPETGVPALLAQTAYRAGEDAAAIAAASEALAARPGDAGVAIIKARAEDRAGRSDAALETLDRLFGDGGASLQACRIAIRIANARRDTDASDRWVERALAIDGDCADAVFHRCMAAARTADFAAARRLLLAFTPPANMPAIQAVRLAFLLLRVDEPAAARRLLAAIRTENAGAAFRLCGASVVCALAAGDLVAAVAHGRALAAHDDADGRSFVVYDDLVAAIDAAPCGGATYAADAKDFRARRDAILRDAPAAAYRDWATQNRARLADIAGRPPPAAIAAPRPRASFVCPVHRLSDVENAVAQIAGQTWRDAEAVFAVNGEVSSDAIRSAWRSEMPLRIVDCRNAGRIGAILNRAIAASVGDVVLRFDADNLYFPHYAERMLAWLDALGAEFVCKRGKFIHLADRDLLFALYADEVFPAARLGMEAGGATFCGRRGLFERFPFDEDAVRGEDTNFVRRCIAAGARVAMVDPFDFVSVRQPQAGAHTWNVGDAELVLNMPLTLVGRGDAIAREVRV